jgi:uncharacterized protein YdeI (YjbR/CyaY-like superfamily)
MTAQRFEATAEARANGRIAIRLPFDPAVAWGDKDPHADPAARRAFESLPTFYRKAIVREVDGVKRAETRQRNLAQVMDRLGTGQLDHAASSNS